MTPTDRAELLVGAGTGDDAAVWRLSAERALVATVDFITPVVDDAYTWGRIAATNSVSDVYAMGATPLFALNLVAWNRDELPMELLGDVLAGGSDVGRDGGFAVVGGHSVDDPEPKYGMAVVGEVHPDRILTNAGLRPGQVLVLSKPLGIGIITTAIKAGQAAPEIEAAAVASMTRLNDIASRVARELGATGATDVTGFGLLGHLGRMATESGVDVHLTASAVPVLDGARALAAAGVVPGGSRRNLSFVEHQLDVDGPSDLDVLLLADAQTSGGLVFGVPEAHADEAVARLVATGHTAAVIGGVASPGAGRIRIG